VADLAAAVQGELPAWASLFATLILALAAAIARRISRRSARPQGERIGDLERQFYLERTRRRQVEAVLLDLGVPLAYWPPDGPNQPRPRPAPAPLDDEDDDQADDFEELGPETIARRVPVPPLPADVGARHRREAQR
jgi:hypothetical protein